VLSRLSVRDLGIFGQEEVLLADRRLLLTRGAPTGAAQRHPDKFFFYRSSPVVRSSGHSVG